MQLPRPKMNGVIIVSGVPGAGKSTIAPLLASHFEHDVHIEVDALEHMIVSGARWPGEEPIEEGYRQLRLRAHNACLLGTRAEAGRCCLVAIAVGAFADPGFPAPSQAVYTQYQHP